MERTKIVHKGKVFTFIRQRKTLPNGYSLYIDSILHPGAVLIVPFLDDGKIVLIRQYRPVIGSYIWELPAGTRQAQERYSLCAHRELIEETGFRATCLTKLGYIYPAPGYTNEKIMIFSAKGLNKVKFQAEPDEVIRVKIFTKKQIQELMTKGKIVDAKTICALKLAGAI